MPWGEAQNYCRENHIDLATVQSVEDWTTLQEVADEEMFSSFAWIGLYNDFNSWRWSYQEESVVFKSWYSGHPDNSGTGEECAGIHYTGSWFDYYCSDTRPFVCSDESTNATEKMVVIKTLKPWLDAQKYCRENYTDLATVRSRDDNNQIVSLIKNLQSNPWIGLYRDSWKWSDQANLTSSTQLTAQRINRKGENCAGAIYDSTSINADVCSGLHYFYCSIGGADEGAEALHLGNLLQGEDPGEPTEGAERAEENSLPEDQRAFHGNTLYP
ncbi:hypothetical protein R3I93_001247 [Phoxinus phoxinus]|uniref:C-type lectin domain-containing protein n=1 Tax=Phoxinus phoxinus TaxID=58324 RepID=A0AAN9HLU2_9TELE